MEVFSTAVNQVFVMFAFMIIGYVLMKSGKLPENASKILSTVLVYVCMPALSFSTCAKNMTVNNVVNQGKMILWGVVVLLVGFMLALALGKIFAKNDFEKQVYVYSFTIPNIGYMGYPMVEAVFGSEALFEMMLFVLPMNVFIYTKGISMLSNGGKSGLKGLLTQPLLVGMVSGIIIGLSGFKLPGLVHDVASSAAGCMAPLAMMLTGCVIAGKPFKEMVSDKKAYCASIIRLVILPLAALVIMLGFKINTSVITVAIATLAMPLGLNTVVFPEAFGGDGRIGARLALISHTLAVITIPVVFGLISMIIA